MNWIDAAILIVIGGSGFLGWKTGVIKWVANLAGAITGIIIAGQYYSDLAKIIPIDTDFDKILAFSVIVIATIVIFWMLANFIKKILNLLLLGWIDRSVGALIGFIVGTLCVSAIASVVVIVPVESLHNALAKSNFLEPMLSATTIIKVLLPAQFDQIDRVLEEGLKWKNQFSG